LEVAVVDERHVYARKEILDDTVEEREIVLQELGHIGVTHGSDQHDVLGSGGVLSSEGTSHDQNGLDGSHTEIVVILLGELLRRELVELHHLS
jgi:hypothetical protein